MLRSEISENIYKDEIRESMQSGGGVDLKSHPALISGCLLWVCIVIFRSHVLNKRWLSPPSLLIALFYTTLIKEKSQLLRLQKWRWKSPHHQASVCLVCLVLGEIVFRYEDFVECFYGIIVILFNCGLHCSFLSYSWPFAPYIFYPLNIMLRSTMIFLFPNVSRFLIYIYQDS